MWTPHAAPLRSAGKGLARRRPDAPGRARARRTLATLLALGSTVSLAAGAAEGVGAPQAAASSCASAQQAGIGVPDNTFGTCGIASATGAGTSYAAATTANGGVVLAGQSGSGTSAQLAAFGFTSAGALNSSFGSSGEVTAFPSNLPSRAMAVAVAPAGLSDAGDVALAGFANVSGSEVPAVALFTSTGALVGTGTISGGSGVSQFTSVTFGTTSGGLPGDVVVSGVIGNPTDSVVVAAFSPTPSGTTLSLDHAFTNAGWPAASSLGAYVNQFSTAGSGDTVGGVTVDSAGNLVVSGSVSCGTTSGLSEALFFSISATTFAANPPLHLPSGCPASLAASVAGGGIALNLSGAGPNLVAAATDGANGAVLGLNDSSGTLTSDVSWGSSGILTASGLSTGLSVALSPSGASPSLIAVSGTSSSSPPSPAVSLFGLADGSVRTAFGSSGTFVGAGGQCLANCGSGAVAQADGNLLITGGVPGSNQTGLAVERLVDTSVSVASAVGVTAQNNSLSAPTAVFPVTLSTGSGSVGTTTTVNFSTSDGSAKAATDYTATSGTVTFNPSTGCVAGGAVTCPGPANVADINVPLIHNARAAADAQLTFSLSLSGASGTGLGTTSGTETITYPGLSSAGSGSSGSTSSSSSSSSSSSGGGSSSTASTPTTSPTTTTPVKSTPIVAPAPGKGYWVVSASGTIYAYGDASLFGQPTAAQLAGAKVTALVATSNGEGYWVVSSKGAVLAYGNAKSYGSVPATRLAGSIVAFATSPGGAGYWLVSTKGQVYAYGGAKSYGSVLSSAPVAKKKTATKAKLAALATKSTQPKLEGTITAFA
ncbi:MAG: SpoIID/LytB domain protein, partial [Acidimicrobiaceae bacterium]|nr:SpoIID/LytB domain protein [Acidimicrobiaceae bacterium]